MRALARALDPDGWPTPPSPFRGAASQVGPEAAKRKAKPGPWASQPALGVKATEDSAVTTRGSTHAMAPLQMGYHRRR